MFTDIREQRKEDGSPKLKADGKTVATVSGLQVLLFDAEGDRPGRALPLEVRLGSADGPIRYLRC